MEKSFLWFWFSCKRQLKRPFFILLLMLLPALLYGAGKLEEKDQSGISIALYAENDWSREVADSLVKQKGMFQFYLCESLEMLQSDVASKKAECGYLLPDDLKKQLDSERLKRIIPVYSSPSTVAADLSKEVVFAALMEVYGKELLQKFVMEDELFASFVPEDTWRETEQLYDNYYQNGSTFSFSYQTESGAERARASAKVSFPVRGIVAVYLFVIGLFAAVTLCTDEKKGLFIPVPYREKLWCRLASMLAPVMLAALSGLTAIAVTGNLSHFGYELTVMFLYGVFVTIFGYLLKLLFRTPVAICSTIPFFIIGSLLLCPIFVDITAWIPALNYLSRCFLPYYYLSVF